ncbi:uncharacterized protein [Primulina eburnea]|uniref:uncharacterized protein n=1 Tax=Primulina eburnea TaxID=1245227 RepID=UPI003C6C1BE7
MNQREEDFTTLIQEIRGKTTQEAKISKLASSNTSVTSWSRLKDPRIVRVSRVFGGKDRHSKVCTAKGLRDRRVRLSVPTAIQLYDLQDRLGLNQPSKVVDWLLDASKNEIDELPPLQIPNGLSFSTQSLRPNPSFFELGASQSDKLQGLKICRSANDPLKHQRSSPFWGKSMDVSSETSGRDESWSRNEDENPYVSSSIFLASRENPTSFSSFLNNISTNDPFFRQDPSNLTLSQPIQSHGLSMVRANEDLHNFSHLPMSSTVSIASGSQVHLYQPGTATESHYSSQIAVMNTELYPKQPNYQTLQLSTSSLSSPVNSGSTHSVRPFHFSMTPNLLSSQNNEANEQNNQSDRFHNSR